MNVASSSSSSSSVSSDTAEIEQICTDFDAAWQSGQRPSIRSYSDQMFGTHSPELIVNLVAIDHEYRSKAGEQPTVEEYTTEFSDVAEEIRAHFLSCSWDETEEPALSRGSRIGDKFILLRESGRGGMGVVWEAREEGPLSRNVAIKFIRPDASPNMVERFRREQQTLAKLHHVNIVSIIEAGKASDGTQYFTMEWLGGKPLTIYCNKKKLGVKQRLRLFEKVCRAVAYAHQRVVVHRDLKPENIMVTAVTGNDPDVKVIDFGLARTDDPRNVSLHDGPIGTPEYMSPEQADRRESLTGDVDTRTDIYSLGVILYELLTGDTPIGRGRAAQEGRRSVINAIVEEAPVRPSRRVVTTTPTTTTTSITPKKGSGGDNNKSSGIQLPAGNSLPLSRQLRGDLDTIIMKALEKDPDDRYNTAAELADDIQCYLAGEVITASRVPRAVRLGKWIKRHPPLTALAVTSIVLFCTSLYSAYLWRREAAELTEVATLRHEAQIRSLWVASPDAAYEIINEVRAQPTLFQAAARYVSDDPIAQNRLRLLQLIRSQPPEIADLIGFTTSREDLDPAELLLICRCIRDWPQASTRMKSHLRPPTTLREASLLCAIDPTSVYLQTAVDGITSQLLEVLPSALPRYTEIFLPAAPLFMASLQPVFVDTSAPKQERYYATDILLSYAARDPDRLFKLLVGSPDAFQFRAIYEALIGSYPGILRTKLDNYIGGRNIHDHPIKYRMNAFMAYALLGLSEEFLSRLATEDNPALNNLIAVKAYDYSLPVDVVAAVLQRGLHPSNNPLLLQMSLNALRQYPRSDVLISAITDLYHTHPDSGVHSACRGLLTVWQQKSVVTKCNDSLPVGPGDTNWYVNSQQQSMAIIDAGSFVMGSPDDEPNRWPDREQQREVEINRRFAIGITEITSRDFARYDPDKDGDATSHPILRVSFYEAAAYCNWLSEREGIPEDQWCYAPSPRTGAFQHGMVIRDKFTALTGYRLPTEAEWEYAARAGTKSRFSWGDDDTIAPAFVNFASASGEAVAQRIPNAFGLFDTTGNAIEWCNEDDKGHPVFNSSYESLRGGSYDFRVEHMRVALRIAKRPGERVHSAGFRIVRTLP
jgi:serine/threonine protein kinase/formylglycine-generating enzyme required for sulfatase activity